MFANPRSNRNRNGDCDGCGILEWSCCCGGFLCVVGTMMLIISIIFAVRYKSIKGAESTECMFFDEIEAGCTVTSQVGKSYSTCGGSKPTYFYKVSAHYNPNNTNIVCSGNNDDIDNNETNIDYWQVYIEGICICTVDSVTKQPYPKYDDNTWHSCYIADCDANEWSWDSPQKHKKDNVKGFIVFGVLYFIAFAICGLGVYYDNK
eukprot:321320_1